jgi:AMP-binding enzyme
LNNPTATKDSITEDGWFKTGDIAQVDKDGFYSIVDRRKELIKYKVSWYDLKAFCQLNTFRVPGFPGSSRGTGERPSDTPRDC